MTSTRHPLSASSSDRGVDIIPHVNQWVDSWVTERMSRGVVIRGTLTVIFSNIKGKRYPSTTQMLTIHPPKLILIGYNQLFWSVKEQERNCKNFNTHKTLTFKLQPSRLQQLYQNKHPYSPLHSWTCFSWCGSSCCKGPYNITRICQAYQEGWQQEGRRCQGGILSVLTIKRLCCVQWYRQACEARSEHLLSFKSQHT